MRNAGRLLLFLALIGSLTVLGRAQAGPTRPAGLAKAGDMLAGNPKNGIKDVGDIYVWKDCSNIYVEYLIVDPTPANPLDNWFITNTQVEVAMGMPSIPQKNGNPIPGQFTYKLEHDYVAGYIETIPLNGFTGQVAIAAHADVCSGGLNALAAAMPDYLEVKVANDFSPRLAYFSTVEIQADTWLNGLYTNQGWCVDRGHGIDAAWGFIPAKAYSSYDLPLPLGIQGDALVDKPENLDIVNWLLNQNFIGKDCGGYGLVTWVDVQVAIWKLLDNETEFTTYDPYDPNRVKCLIDTAALHDGYVPSCREKLWVVISPNREGLQCQTIIIPVPVPCEKCETAWAGEVLGPKAYQYLFPGKNWATYLFLVPFSTCPL